MEGIGGAGGGTGRGQVKTVNKERSGQCGNTEPSVSTNVLHNWDIMSHCI